MPDNVIDNLSLQIEANAKDSGQVIDGLIRRLGSLNEAVSKFTKRKINIGITPEQTENFRQFANALENLKIDKLTAYANLTSQIKKVDLGLKTDSGTNLSMFAMGLQDLDMDKFRQYGEISQTVKSIPTGIGESSAKGFSIFVDTIHKADLGKLQNFADVFRDFKGVNIGFGEKGVENIAGFVVAMNMADMDKIREFADVFREFGGVNLGVTEKGATAFTSFANATQALDVEKLRILSTLDFSNMDKLAEAAKHVTVNFGSYVSVAKGAVQIQEKLASSTATVKRETSKASRTFSFANTAIGKLVNAIKRIAFYRAIRSAIKALTQGFGEGIENLYYWSQMVGTTFAPRMDQLATATAYLKNGFASMFSPLIEYAIPIIDRLIDKLVDMFNVAQELFARLTGAPTWNKALKYPVNYKDALDDAAGSAKALQNILMDFDEINAINTPRSGSRGHGGDEKDYESMFQLMETATGGNPFGRFGGIFEDIGNKVETALGIVQRFWNFFKGLNFKPLQDSMSSFWSVVSPIIDEILGIADWFEQKVLEPVTQFLVEKGIPAALDTLSVVIDNVWKALKPLVDGIKHFWDENGSWIMKLVGDASLTGLDAIKESFTKIGDFFKNNDKIKSIIENLSAIVKGIGESKFFDSLLAFIKTAAFETFMTTIENTLTAIEPALDILSGIMKIVGSLFKTQYKGEHKALEGLEDLGEGLMKLLAAPFEMILRTLADVLDALGTLSPACKDAAHRIRVFIGDEVEEINKDVSNAGVTIRKTAEGTWKAVDETTGEYVSITGARISSAQLAINRETANGISQVLKWGSEGAKSSQQVQQWLEYCRVNGVDPMTGDIIWATEETIGLGNAGKTAAQNTAIAWGNTSKTVNTAFGSISTSGKTASSELTIAFASALSPNTAFRLGKDFGASIQNGLNGAGIGWNLGAQMAANAQAALNMSPLQLRATINATINSVNANDKWRAALAAAGVSVAGFATGGFPTPSSFFYAGENGVPELMGTVGGRTAVAGGAEITGIREAIVEQGQREEGLLRSLISAVQNKDLSLVANSATGRWVNRALKAYSGVSG